MDDLDIEDFKNSQINRRIDNLIRLGTIDQVDYSSARVRVRAGGLLTGWLSWLTGRAGGDVEWSPPELGEKVVFVCFSGYPEMGVVVGSLYHAARPANGDRADLRRVTFADGTVCEYDRSAHRFTLNVPVGGAELVVNSGGKVTVAATAELNLTSETEIYLAAPNIAMQGRVSQVGGDIISDGISLQTHTHGGVEAGGAITAPPN